MGPCFSRKYNTLLVTGTTAIRIPIIKRGVVDFAVGADWTPSAGDVKINIDGAGPANVTNLPTAVASGNGAYWEFILTAAELSSKTSIVTIVDSATKAVEDTCFVVETFGNASALYQADLSAANLPADVKMLLGTAWLTPGVAGTPDVNAKQAGGTALTGRDIGASVLLSPGTGTGQLDITSGVAKANAVQLLGTAWLTPGVAGTPDVNAKLWNGLTTVALPLVPTTAGRTLDVTATGEAGIDLANVGAPTTTLNLSGTTIKTATDVATATTAIQADTDDIQTRLPAALTSDGLMKVDALRIAGVLQTGGTVGTAASGTTTTMVDAALTQADTDYWKGQIILFTSGNIAGQARLIAAFTPASDTITFTPATTQAVGTNTYEIWPNSDAVFTRLGAPAGASTAADIAAIKAILPPVVRNNTASAGAGTTITLDGSASAVTDFYKNDLILLVSGAGAGQARFITAYNGGTKVATVTAWATNPDNTSVFMIIGFDAIVGATAPTAAQVATAVWQDLLAGSDFGTASSIGALLKLQIDAAISSRMATYVQPTGFLAATFPSGTVASTTNLAAGTIAGVSGAVASVSGPVGSVTGSVGGSVGSVLAPVSITSNIKKNQALAKFSFLMTDSTNHNPAAGKTVTCTRSINGAAFAAGTLVNVAEVTNGVYTVDFGAGDLNGNVIILQCTATGCDTTFERIVTAP